MRDRSRGNRNAQKLHGQSFYSAPGKGLPQRRSPIEGK
jgi:hypothetical protein